MSPLRPMSPLRGLHRGPHLRRSGAVPPPPRRPWPGGCAASAAPRRRPRATPPASCGGGRHEPVRASRCDPGRPRPSLPGPGLRPRSPAGGRGRSTADPPAAIPLRPRAGTGRCVRRHDGAGIPRSTRPPHSPCARPPRPSPARRAARPWGGKEVGSVMLCPPQRSGDEDRPAIRQNRSDGAGGGSRQHLSPGQAAPSGGRWGQGDDKGPGWDRGGLRRPWSAGAWTGRRRWR